MKPMSGMFEVAVRLNMRLRELLCGFARTVGDSGRRGESPYVSAHPATTQVDNKSLRSASERVCFYRCKELRAAGLD